MAFNIVGARPWFEAKLRAYSAVIQEIAGGGGGGSVNSVNGQTGTVVLDAEDVGALSDDYTPAWDDISDKPSTFPATTPVATATALETSRNIALTGDVTGSASFNGTANASITTALGSGVIVNADVNPSAAISLSKLGNTTQITADDGTVIAAGTVQATLEALADQIGPARVIITGNSTVANTVPSGTKFYSTSATGTTQTLAPGAAVGKTFNFFQTAAGSIILAAGSGESLVYESGFDPESRGQGAVISAEKISSTVWLVYGALVNV